MDRFFIHPANKCQLPLGSFVLLLSAAHSGFKWIFCLYISPQGWLWGVVVLFAPRVTQLCCMFFFFCELQRMSTYWGGGADQRECPWYYFTRAITLRVHQWEVNLFINPQCKFLPLSSAWIMPFIFNSTHQQGLYNLQVHNRTWGFETASKSDVKVQLCMQIRRSFPINSRLVEYAN